MVIVSGNSFLIYKQRQWGDFINWERVYFCSVWSRIMNSSVDPSSRHQDTVCWAGFDGWWWQQLPNKEFISLSLCTSQDLKTTAGQHGQYQYWLHEYHRGEGRGGLWMSSNDCRFSNLQILKCECILTWPVSSCTVIDLSPQSTHHWHLILDTHWRKVKVDRNLYSLHIISYWVVIRSINSIGASYLFFQDIWRSVGVSLLLIFGSCITYNVLNRESERACCVMIVEVGVKMNVFSNNQD